jgi:hypothetical protein
MERPKLLTIDRPIEYLLSGISSTSAIITRFIRSVRVAHADLAAVTRDLSDLRLILELLRDEPGVPLVLQGQMLLVLESCGNILIYIDNILSRSPDPAKWIESGRNETASCRSSLAVFREALSLALEVTSLYDPLFLHSFLLSLQSHEPNLAGLQRCVARPPSRCRCRQRQHTSRGKSFAGKHSIHAARSR